ncbi:L-type lectin-domain containing receptor kinase VIII.1 [Dichanthelium oligosanthes]|uniref:L-type lectin-domain containing receptor kinase VIII.1 n=1 Tax=Dichanthelium oligosanthes TaxID=888268 RepID=A0A1E5W0P5_9POAL|nr:L-type lectin-domain containing receptor kinase VIII.1 [Dichanthelium oligosanthes]
MCSADFSRSDCNDCLIDASSSAGGLAKRCPGSATVVAIFDQCMLRYSNDNFFGAAETGIIYTWTNGNVSMKSTYGNNLKQGLGYLSEQAASSPQRFAASASAPYALVQCTWDLPSDKCKKCIDTLSANMSEVGIKGERKSYSCRVRYSNSSFSVVPLVVPPPTKRTTSQQPVDEAAGPSSSSPWARNSPPGSTASSSNIGAVVGSVAGAVIVIAGLVVAYRCVMQRRRSPSSYHLMHKPEVRPIVNVPRQFKLSELKKATKNYSEKLGSGAFGEVFKGELKQSGGDLVVVAVKRILQVDEKARNEYMTEIKTISELRHQNLVLLKGWCHEDGELLLVYEYMANGSLSAHLHRPTTPVQPSWMPLEWEKRCKIIDGIASGLVYLHYGSEKGIIHRDIKPANILLDGSFTAKLGDFGLVRQVNHEGTSHTMTVGGSLCYLDPDYMTSNRASKKSDVYSFGVVLLEILCGEKPNLIGETNTLIKKVRELHDSNQILQAADNALRNVENETMKRMLWVGLLCVHPDHRHRPDSTKVLSFLRDNISSVPRPPHVIAATGVRPTEVHAPREFTYDELSIATSNFSDNIGSGTYGQVYKGTLEESGDLIAVKKITRHERAIDEYITEVRTISRLRHRNLVHLRGWCNENGELLLVYEYMAKGSLRAHLHHPDNQQSWEPLDWKIRYKIITGVASGLHYLHTGSAQGIIHRDVKPANVLLDEGFNAKLADFGLVRQVNHEGTSRTMSIGGTPCYLDPDYKDSQRASKKSDVYSFGVVMLEILCGEKPKLVGGVNSLVKKVRGLHDRNKILEAADSTVLHNDNKELMRRLLVVGLLCVQEDRHDRPTSTVLTTYLTGNVQVPEPPRGVQSGQSIVRQNSATIYSNASSNPLPPLDPIREN